MIEQDKLPDWFYQALHGESADKTLLDCCGVLKVVCDDLSLEPIAINAIISTKNKAVNFCQRLQQAAADVEWEGAEILSGDFPNDFYIGENFALRRTYASSVELYVLHPDGELDTRWVRDVGLIGESPFFVSNIYGAIGTVSSSGNFLVIVDGDTGWGDGEGWDW